MGSETRTLQEAADHLGVHYMTAYRYVRLGLLPAERVGRSWAVRSDDLAAFQAERESGDAGLARPPADWASRLERRLLAGDRLGVLGVLEGALAAGTEPVELYLDVVAPAMAAVGDGWAAGRVEVSVEHRASVILTQSLAIIGARFARRGVSRGVVVFGAVAGERHALPVRLLSDVCRAAGYEVMDLGDDVPVDSFAAVVDGLERLVAVGVSTTMPAHADAVRETVTALRQVTDAPILVGGAGIVDGEQARALGADHYAPDARAVVDVLEELPVG